MKKPDWKIFKAKFSENPQSNFEWLCYLLFCSEYKKYNGIFRYFNQAGIENEPIKYDKKTIGWQAKYYECSLSKRRNDLIKTIEMSKRHYPSLTTLIIYSNASWGQYKGKAPKSQIEIEKHAKNLALDIVWQASSFFESPFATIENEIIFNHFFSLNKSIFDDVREKETHTKYILNDIRNSIIFSNNKIKLNRTEQIQKITNSLSDIIILCGEPGVGKTALIKSYFQKSAKDFPIYIFKAIEFNIDNINRLFEFSCFNDFIEVHKQMETKVIVIDSAERLLDLNNIDVFKEFLLKCLEYNWRIIFTARSNYLNDLSFHFFEDYNLSPEQIYLETLSQNEVSELSEKFNFLLPDDERLLDLLRVPFYLNKYLKFYCDNKESDYSLFKKYLWENIILKRKPERERCFLDFAFERASTGKFFISPKYGTDILNKELLADGILQYESPHGYFITHDIYEEWALEKKIQCEYKNTFDHSEFFHNIGNSLPIRRAFRSWISENILLKELTIFDLITKIIDNQYIASIWKDEVYISVLLSKYSHEFFKYKKEELLNKGYYLLKKIAFLLQIACKEIDDTVFNNLGIRKSHHISLKYVFTKPKGNGWDSMFLFIYENIEQIGKENLSFILPLLYEWNKNNTNGKTTRLSSLIALSFYQSIIAQGFRGVSRKRDSELITTILFGTFEIQVELKKIFENIISNKWKNHNDPFYELNLAILSKFEGIKLCEFLPTEVLKLANLFWVSDEENKDYSYTIDMINGLYGINNCRYNYFPVSAYQTPIYYLLSISFSETLDFIISFVNKAVLRYANNTNRKLSIEEVSIILDNDTIIKQYLSPELWGMYRGMQSAPNILVSIHMALEKFLLRKAKEYEKEELHAILFYLLKNTVSASITSVVTSIVLAYPEKTFGIAKILFNTREFFFYDLGRKNLEQSAKQYYSIAYSSSSELKIFIDERLQTCDDNHRMLSLEDQFLKYQLFRSTETNESDAAVRKKKLFEILDRYYSELSNEHNQDKLWRLCLARMDSRNMAIQQEKNDDKIVFTFIPEIDSDLEEYSKKTLAKTNKLFQYSNLFLWSHYKFRQEENFKDFNQYENNPVSALDEVRDIMGKLKNIPSPELNAIKTLEEEEEENLIMFNYSIPAYVCAVLLKYHLDVLSNENREYCKNIILRFANETTLPQYKYSILGPTSPSFNALSIILKEFPEEIETIKKILSHNLLFDIPINMRGDSLKNFAIENIIGMWENNFNDAYSLLLGHFILKKNYEETINRIRIENRNFGIFDLDLKKAFEVFYEENNTNLVKILSNSLTISDIENLLNYDLTLLGTAFNIIPLGNKNKEIHHLTINIATIILEKLTDNNFSNSYSFNIKYDFLDKLAKITLTATDDYIEEFIILINDNFQDHEIIGELFTELIYAEDRMRLYLNFWKLWNALRKRIFEICRNEQKTINGEFIVQSYLFAEVEWKEDTKDWPSFTTTNQGFIKSISEEIGYYPAVFYSISKLLNNIGNPFINEGIFWISDMLRDNKNLHTDSLHPDTVYYVEKITKEYINHNRYVIKQTVSKRKRLTIILDFLITKGSVTGYLLREYIH